MNDIDEILERFYKLTDNRLSGIESYFYKIIYNYFVDNLETKQNVIKLTNKNIDTVTKLNSIDEKMKEPLSGFGEFILKSIISLINFTGLSMEKYDARAISASQSVQKKVVDHLEKNIQFNNNLEAVYGEIKQDAISLMSKYEGISLSELREYLRDKITDKRIVTKYYNRWTGDIYSQYQRAAANEIRKDLGMKYAMYQGGLIETSRQFCKERNNKLFSEEEILSWQFLNWDGKPSTGYNPLYDCGGYNCRHRLDWVSEAFAKSWLKRNGG